jgi:hypothetical protein
MRRHRLPVDDIGHFLLLIRAYDRNNVENSRVDILTTVADDADDHFLPAILIPGLAAIVLAPCLVVVKRPCRRPLCTWP